MNERPDQDVMTNPRADRVRRTARLAGRSSRQRQGLFLAEGPQPAREALKTHLGTAATDDGGATGPAGLTAWRRGQVVETVYISERLGLHDPELAGMVDRARESGVPVRRATEEVLAAMSDAVTGQGILAVCRIPQPAVPDGGPGLDTGLAELIGRAGTSLVAVLCRVQDPGNAGTILRTADAAGVDAVVLTTGSVDLYNPKTVRSTAGSLFHLPAVTGVSLAQVAEAVGRAGIQVLAADGSGTVRLDRAPSGLLQAPTAWLFGNEARGLSEQERLLATARVAVPLYGAAESLNVATAATVCLYASAMAQAKR